jgi:hypothetical protein
MSFQPTEEVANFNSDDEVFEMPQKPHFRAGERTLASMNERRITDRKASAVMIRTQTNVGGVAGTVYVRALWTNRLDNFAIFITQSYIDWTCISLFLSALIYSHLSCLR